MALDPRIIQQAGSQGLQSGLQNLLAVQQNQRQNRLARAQEQQSQQEQQRQNRLAQIAQQSFTPGKEATPALPQEPAMGPVRPGEQLPNYPAQPGQSAQSPQFDLQGFQSRLLGEGMVPEAIQTRQLAAPMGGQDPSAVREYEYFVNQVQPQGPEAVSKYMALKRSGFTLGGQRFGAGTDAGLGAEPVVTAEQTARGEAEVTKGEGLGKVAAKNIEQASEQIPKISENIRNLDEVVRLIDDEGAVTGPVAKRFPSFRKSSVQLDNMRRRLGLDVIGSVTFGALSEAELNMALDTALPTSLKGEALSDWARQKKAAQSKLRDYLQDQVSFLSQPGNTMADWYARIEQRQQEPQGQNIGRFQIQVED